MVLSTFRSPMTWNWLFQFWCQRSADLLKGDRSLLVALSGILGTQYLICSRPNWYGVPGIPARMHLRGPRKGIKPSAIVSSYKEVSLEKAYSAGRPDSKVTGNPVLFPRSVWTWPLIRTHSIIAMD